MSTLTLSFLLRSGHGKANLCIIYNVPPLQGREAREPVPSPPEILMGQKTTGMNNFAYFRRWNAVSSVLLRTRKLAEFCCKLGVFSEKLGEFALGHK